MQLLSRRKCIIATIVVIIQKTLHSIQRHMMRNWAWYISYSTEKIAEHVHDFSNPLRESNPSSKLQLHHCLSIARHFVLGQPGIMTNGCDFTSSYRLSKQLKTRHVTYQTTRSSNYNRHTMRQSSMMCNIVIMFALSSIQNVFHSIY